MMILHEKEIIEYLKIPSIPKKEWNQKSSFENGVAVVILSFGRLAYAVCSFDSENDAAPKIKKVFGLEPFCGIDKIFVVPQYMDNSTDNADLDEESKKRAEQLAKEAQELENENVVSDDKLLNPKSEYYFDHITNDEQAKAYIQSYNSRNHVKGRIPTTHDGLLMRLAVIYSNTQKK